eukprot:218837-Prymnesium_polylepis.1
MGSMKPTHCRMAHTLAPTSAKPRPLRPATVPQMSPTGAACLGNIIPPITQPGYGVLGPVDASGVYAV